MGGFCYTLSYDELLLSEKTMWNFNLKKLPKKPTSFEPDEQIEKSGLNSRREAFQYLSRLNQKTDLLAERFARGKVESKPVYCFVWFLSIRDSAAGIISEEYKKPHRVAGCGQ